MRLTSLYNGQYKNLRDFSLNFDGSSSFIDVFSGKTPLPDNVLMSSHSASTITNANESVIIRSVVDGF